MLGLLIAVASLVEHGLQVGGLQELQHVASVVVATWASFLCGVCDLPRPGIEPVSPVLAGGLLTTGPHEEIFTPLFKGNFSLMWIPLFTVSVG